MQSTSFPSTPSPACGSPMAIAVDRVRALSARYYACPDAGAAHPLVLHLHGGAFVAGLPAQGAPVAQLLCDAGAAVLSLDYPVAPAHPFPRPLETAYAALVWVQQQRKRLACTGSRLFVAGEEAGGNLAAALAMVARDRGGPELAGQILLSPMLDVCVATASQRQAGAGHVGCPWADGWRSYLAEASDAMHPYAAPANAMRLAGLPPALLITARDDPLRDETHAYAQRLQQAGVPAGEAVLSLATEWPLSYRDPSQADAPWARAVRTHLRRFLEAHR
ncbi:alpha/beta hydrolase [Schlegelella sp. S2-27]|uniref:Alpha/beta hydrolase n=1 Tax=Caldimonas mangrovi TaxID=2944811 RepID=A0ABT0YUU3_9BURK|nr:alpha/beta hydrolase [Caldimonas mangrovi]MCM5681588.1 alpha/beta hydrolase [Caldimonas mangrovi]